MIRCPCHQCIEGSNSVKEESKRRVGHTELHLVHHLLGGGLTLPPTRVVRAAVDGDFTECATRVAADAGAAVAGPTPGVSSRYQFQFGRRQAADVFRENCEFRCIFEKNSSHHVGRLNCKNGNLIIGFPRVTLCSAFADDPRLSRPALDPSLCRKIFRKEMHENLVETLFFLEFSYARKSIDHSLTVHPHRTQ